MAEDQEGKNAPAPQDDDKIIKEFNSIPQETILRGYEEKNRDRIAEASLMVRDAFDKKWKKVTGNSYYQPSTTVQTAAPSQIDTEYVDPRSRRYRAKVTFSKIMWNMIKRRIGKKDIDLFVLQGEVADTKKERPIFQNLAVNRLKEILGDKAALKIINEAKEKEYAEGEVKGTFELEVEGYWEVIFTPQKDPNDPIDVRLMWEGQCLIIKRMKKVVLPGFYIEVADNAMRDHFIQTPESGRKKVGTVQEYPYTVMREAHMDEYLVQKAAGDEVMRAVRSREDG